MLKYTKMIRDPMLDRLMGKKKPRLNRPLKEKRAKLVPASRFNQMIDYYTAELQSRIDEVNKLKQENEMLVKTSLKNASRSDELRLEVSKLQEEVRLLKEKLGRR